MRRNSTFGILKGLIIAILILTVYTHIRDYTMQQNYDKKLEANEIDYTYEQELTSSPD